MKIKRIAPLLVLALLMFSCSSDGIDDNQQIDAKSNSKERPFKVRGSGDFAVEAPTECAPLVQIGLQGGGNGTHIGNFSVALTWCTDFAGTESITGVVTAANGDELNIYLTGSDAEAGYGDYAIDGGTGRFAEASGAFRLFTTTVFTGEGVGTYSNYGSGYIVY